ncbi:nucleotide-sugar transporter [Pholiota conissans]|uniref:Nucleotide-sugar transporter n=1 Tax=Pholiota conissans TaxID=109636 RepID=A0A9P5ZD39_9AGAR|nr:nucleotide-sugar transporter [Pholiota conissans]
MSTIHPPIQLSLNLKPDQHAHDDVELALPSPPASTAIPSLWGIPLKYLSLVTLAVQNSALTIIMHYSRVSTPQSRQYSAATAVLMNEILKGTISLIIAFSRVDPQGASYDSAQAPYTSQRTTLSRRLAGRLRKLSKEVFSPDCWKLSIPAILYVIQNNLQYVAASNLEAATFQVTYQMKILTTATFSVMLLRKKLSSSQWISLLFLAIGVGVVQIQVGAEKHGSAAASVTAGMHALNPMKGFIAVVAACFTSGLAGVYFEMVLKNSQADLWVRNVQLSLFSLLPAIAPIIFAQRAYDVRGGKGLISILFEHFGAWAWATVWVQVLGGLITAMVIKYSDNILKGFATSLSIVISFLASVALFDFQMTITFILGSAIVLIATWLYNQHPARVNIVKDSWSWNRNEKLKDLSTLRSPPPLQPQFIGIASASSRSSLSSSSSSLTSSTSSSLISTLNSPDPESRAFIR